MASITKEIRSSGTPHVAQAVADLVLGPRRVRRGAQLGAAHHGQGHQHGHVREAVEGEGPAVAPVTTRAPARAGPKMREVATSAL